MWSGGDVNMGIISQAATSGSTHATHQQTYETGQFAYALPEACHRSSDWDCVIDPAANHSPPLPARNL